MKVLAFDLGTRTAYCYGEAGKSPERVGLFVLPNSPTPGGRLTVFDHCLCELLDLKPDVIAHERALNLRGGQAVHVYGQLFGILHLRCHERGITPLMIAPQTAKKSVTGNGRAEKQIVLWTLRKRFPELNIAGLDEGDAVAVWLAACERTKGGERAESIVGCRRRKPR